MRSASGSTRSPSHQRRSSRRCDARRKESRRDSAQRDSRRSRTPPASKWSLHPRTWIVLRLPRFKYLRPKTAREAAHMAAELGPRAMFVAGGTDLFPKLKRRQFEIETLISLGFLPREVQNSSTDCVVGAGVTLAAASRDEPL